MIINIGSQHTATCTLTVHGAQAPSLPTAHPGIVS
jgi:hypothetical protein